MSPTRLTTTPFSHNQRILLFRNILIITLNVSHRNGRHHCLGRTRTCTPRAIPLLFRSTSLTFVPLCDRCARNRVCRNDSKIGSCSGLENDRSNKTRRNLRNSDCKTIVDSVRSATSISNACPTRLVTGSSSSNSPGVGRNCP